MSAETLFTAARRIERFIRIDDEKEGGLLSIDTVKANMILARQLELERAASSRQSIIAEVDLLDGEWWIRCEGSTEAVCIGPAKAQPYQRGDSVEITIRRIEL